MSEFPFQAVVAVHGEDRFAARSNNASGAPDEGAAKGFHLPEAPQRGTLWGRTAGAAVDLDLEFAGEVVGKDAGEHVELVADPCPDRYVIHLAVRLEFGEDALLRPATFMEGNDVARVRPLVGDNGLEFIPVFNGLEQVELDRLFVSVPDLLSDEDESMAGIPRLRLPTCFEVIDSLRQAAPFFFCLQPDP